MKLRAVAVLHAVHGPHAAVGRKMFCLRGMPVARFENRLAAIEKLLYKFVERRDHFISAGHRQRSARTKIVLHINYNQSFLLMI